MLCWKSSKTILNIPISPTWSIYQITFKGYAKQVTFLEYKDHTDFLEVVCFVVKRLSLIVPIFCLISNNHHLLIKTT